MHTETINQPATVTGAIIGYLAGMYQSFQGDSLLHSVLTSALTAAVSCLVSTSLQVWIKRKDKHS